MIFIHKRMSLLKVLLVLNQKPFPAEVQMAQTEVY